MKRILAIVLSAVTLVGGHFVNRRFDRALFFFVTLIVWSALIYFYAMVRVPVDAGAGKDPTEIFSYYWTILFVGISLLWLASLVLTSFDAKRAEVSYSNRWTISGVVGAGGLTLLTVLLLLMPFLPFLADTVFSFYADSSDLPEGVTAKSYRDRQFNNTVHLGRGSSASRELSKAPSGTGYLRGQVLYEGKPAAGVVLSLALNGKYETDRLTTDENGIFTARLPTGEWELNRVVTHEWSDRPRGDLIIVNGTEPKLVDGRYNELYWLEREGVRLTATDKPGDPQVNLAIRKRVVMSWPTETVKRAPATVADGVIAWTAYPDAETYLLRITELKREGRTTALRTVTTKTIKGATQFRLADLAAVAGEEEREYQVAVHAFARDGSLLSESKEKFDGLTFVLTDKKQLVRDEDRALLTAEVNQTNIEELQRNNRRLDAVETLVRDGMLVEAEKLLAKTKGRSDPGRKTAVSGYLLAKRGRCADANKLFAKAQLEAGRNCVPDYYRECRAAPERRKR